ncbi:hypothetical protein C8R47DRAFT_117528 [Mycena vitilis]|nr:hypothetical protein C8R47DRAFT_117528 [Mycena vitilis]
MPSFTSFVLLKMPSKPLEESLAIAEALRTRCQTEPDMNAYQPIATSAVEICVAATPGSRSKTSWLAVHAVKNTSALIEQGANLPMTPERQLGLQRFERALDNVRRHMESIPERPSSKSSRFRFSALRFDRESWYLKGDLKATYKSLIECSKKRKSVAPSDPTPNECIIEIASISTRVADAICEIPLPGLALGKPVVAIVALICETAKTVKSNRTSARALARHAHHVTDSIVARAGPALQGDSLTELSCTLQQVQDLLTVLQTRTRATSWIFAAKDKERFTELNNALDRSLQVFSASGSIFATEISHGNAQALTTLVATVHRVENNVKRTMSLVHGRQTPSVETPNIWGGAKPAFVPFLSYQTPLSLFFFYQNRPLGCGKPVAVPLCINKFGDLW